MSEETSLAVPLRQSQVSAAGKLRARMAQWTTSDEVLNILRERFPGSGLPENLLKVVVLNQLYGTNVYGVWPMATHITKIMETGPEVAPDLVERLARVPPPVSGRPRRYLSFASKFTHFFLSADLPLFDSYAARSIDFHLGLRTVSGDTPPPYATYVASFERLRAAVAEQISTRELDHYLWVSGMYRAWVANPDAQISVEARSVFTDKSEEIETLLRELMTQPSK